MSTDPTDRPSDAHMQAARESAALLEHECDALGEDPALTAALLDVGQWLDTWRAARRTVLIGLQRAAVGDDHPTLAAAGAEQVETGCAVVRECGPRLTAALGRLEAVTAAGRTARTGGA